MVPLIAISGYAFAEWDISVPEFLRLATRLGATRCLRKPFKPTTLLGVIDECLRDVEPHRRQIATLAAVVGARAEAADRAGREGEASRRAAVVMPGGMAMRTLMERRRGAPQLE